MHDRQEDLELGVGEIVRAQRLNDAGEGDRWHREVVQQPGRAADLSLRAIDRIGEGGHVSGVGRRVAEPGGESVPGLRIELATAELHDRGACVCTEGLVRQRSPGGADDPVPGRQEAGAVEVVEPWEDLAPGEIARYCCSRTPAIFTVATVASRPGEGRRL